LIVKSRPSFLIIAIVNVSTPQRQFCAFEVLKNKVKVAVTLSRIVPMRD